jgi:hypothetical protein
MVADPLALQYILNGSAFERSGMLNVMVDLIFGEKSVVASKGMFCWPSYHHVRLSVH